MSVADTLREARRRIEEPEKWCQFTMQLGDAVCPFQAIRIATEDVDSLAVCHGVYEVFHSVIDDESIMCWNDAPERTHAEVLAAFDRAIALAELEKP